MAPDRDGRVLHTMREYGARLGLGDVDSKPLTTDEADSSRDTLIAALQWVSESIDTSLTFTNRAHATADFWALDDEDAGKLADFWLARARKNHLAAYAVRVTLQINGARELLAIGAPRVVKTFQFYMANGGLGY